VGSFPEDGFIRVPRSMGVMRNASRLSIRALSMDLPATFSVGDGSHRWWCAFRSPANMNGREGGGVVDKKVDVFLGVNGKTVNFS
jgi:hypothetical protein